MTPPKLTTEQIRQTSYKCDEGQESAEFMLAFSHAIAALRDRQWQEMLAGPEPVALVRSEQLRELAKCNGMSVWAENPEIHPEPHLTAQGLTLLFTHPAPDHTAVMQQALEALELLLDESMVPLTDESMATENSVAVWQAGGDALAALKQALGEQP